MGIVLKEENGESGEGESPKEVVHVLLALIIIIVAAKGAVSI